MQQAYEHCEALVRERDRERFLSSLFAPAERRKYLAALYAFDLEIERVPGLVREPMAGEIRFQWWREVLAGERADEAQANPVASALLDTIRTNRLSVAQLGETIDARQFDLLCQPMETLEALNRYLDATSGGMLRLGAQVLEPGWDASGAAISGGRALGIVRVLRGLARDASKGRLFVPLDTLAKNEVHTASVMAGESSKGLLETLAGLREMAAFRLAEFRKSGCPAAALPAFLPLALVPAYLKRLAKQTDPFRERADLSGVRSQFALWRAARRGAV